MQSCIVARLPLSVCNIAVTLAHVLKVSTITSLLLSRSSLLSGSSSAAALLVTAQGHCHHSPHLILHPDYSRHCQWPIEAISRSCNAFMSITALDLYLKLHDGANRVR